MKISNLLGLAALLAAGTAAAAERVAIAAPGLVEPFGEERTVGSEIIGIIKEMKVDENDPVQAGQVVAIIENSEISARLAAAKADAALAQAELDRLVHGARPEERRQAQANLAEAEAQFAWANKQQERRAPLAKSGAISISALDDTTNQLAVAAARRRVAAEALRLIEIGTRQEDIDAARAKLDSAKAAVAINQALLDKTIIRSPVDGVVLRRHRVAGEAVGNMPPTSIITIGDVSHLRVRAEVDETDIAKLKAGRRVKVTADAFPGKSFMGTISRISKRLGPKLVETGRPADKVDSKVLQVLVDLDAGTDLPVGLRVDAFVEG